MSGRVSLAWTSTETSALEDVEPVLTIARRSRRRARRGISEQRAEVERRSHFVGERCSCLLEQLIERFGEGLERTSASSSARPYRTTAPWRWTSSAKWMIEARLPDAASPLTSTRPVSPSEHRLPLRCRYSKRPYAR